MAVTAAVTVVVVAVIHFARLFALAKTTKNRCFAFYFGKFYCFDRKFHFLNTQTQAHAHSKTERWGERESAKREQHDQSNLALFTLFPFVL